MTPPSDHSEPSGANPASPPVLTVAGERYREAPFGPPKLGSLYCVHDKSHADRIIRVIGVSPDGTLVQVETLTEGVPSKRPVQLSVELLARQAARGWCRLLLPLEGVKPAGAAAKVANPPDADASPAIRLDSQNFGRCCADIARANLKFSTQLVKDVGDGPFRAGDYQQAFLNFEQIAVGFTSAVAASRRAIADGRRALTAEKGNLSGKEIQERTAAFVRQEQLTNAAERSFNTILEGLRVYLRTQ